MDRIVNNIQLVQKLTCMLRTKKKKKYNQTVWFSKYVVMLIFVVKVITLDYNQVCNQTLFIILYFPIGKFLAPNRFKIIFFQSIMWQLKRSYMCKLVT